MFAKHGAGFVHDAEDSESINVDLVRDEMIRKDHAE